MNKLSEGDLRPGDVLLHSGKGQVAELIAWAGGSYYSHAAYLCSDLTLREASKDGVRVYKLSDRLPDTKDYAFIDVYRRPGGISPIPQAAQVDLVANHYLGTPYPLNDLVYLGIVCAVRDKLPDNKWLRWMLRTITDQFINSDPNFMVCSELCYRAYAEAQLVPSLKPQIVVPDQSTLPFPDIDWVALYKEWYDDTHPHQVGVSRDVPPVVPEVTDAELRERYAKVLARMGAKARPENRAVTPSADPPMIEVNPNPRTIMPSDLQHSPDFQLLGRVTGPV